MTTIRKVAVAALCTGAAVAGGIAAYNIIEKKKFIAVKSQITKDLTVTAHTGSMGTKANSIESIEVGAANADIIEFDLNFLPDGTPVLSHNKPKGTECVTASQAFEALSKCSGTLANVDVKTVANLPEVQRLAEEWGVLDRIFFTGVKMDFVEAVKRDCPKVSYYLNYNVDPAKNKSREYLATLVETVRNCGAIGINTNFRLASKELVEYFHSENLLVSLWTARSNTQVYKILSMLPDNITTIKPDFVRTAIGR